MRVRRLLMVAGLVGGCARSPRVAVDPASAPSYMVGEFEDDYGDRHTITAAEWQQRPSNRFHIIRWVPSKRYLVAHNDSANRGEAGRWTRIDWVRLEGMAPYEWAFCFSAYNAPSAAAAESVTVAHPETPKTGCNGFPYTRMRRPT